MLLIFFGLPGAGKTYAARVVAHEFELKFHDGDDDLPRSMIEAIAASQPISDAQRDEFFARLIDHVRALRAKGYPLAGFGNAGNYFYNPFATLTQNLSRMSVGFGYRIGPPLVLKFEYSRERGQLVNGVQRDREDFLSTEVGLKF